MATSSLLSDSVSFLVILLISFYSHNGIVNDFEEGIEHGSEAAEIPEHGIWRSLKYIHS